MKKLRVILALLTFVLGFMLLSSINSVSADPGDLDDRTSTHPSG